MKYLCDSIFDLFMRTGYIDKYRRWIDIIPKDFKRTIYTFNKQSTRNFSFDIEIMIAGISERRFYYKSDFYDYLENYGDCYFTEAERDAGKLKYYESRIQKTEEQIKRFEFYREEIQRLKIALINFEVPNQEEEEKVIWTYKVDIKDFMFPEKIPVVVKDEGLWIQDRCGKWQFLNSSREGVYQTYIYGLRKFYLDPEECLSEFYKSFEEFLGQYDDMDERIEKSKKLLEKYKNDIKR